MKILSLKEKATWNNYLQKLKHKSDIYFSPEYYQIAENQGDGKAICFVFEKNEKLAIYPFLLNSVNKFGYTLHNQYYDIQGAYGYNGVLSNTNDIEYRESFYNVFKNYCYENNIIAEFTRFHPLLKNHLFSKDHMKVEYDRDTIYFDLSEQLEVIYSKISRKTRQGIKRGIDKKLLFQVARASDYMKFYEMYVETMNRVSADKYFFFSLGYFKELSIINNSVQFNVSYNNKLIASAFCIYSDIFFHFHLAASGMEYQNLRPNNFLMWKLIEYAKQKGFKYFFIGGGRSSDNKDSLMRYKSGFSNKKAAFFIGKKIHDKSVYQKIIAQWKNKNFEKVAQNKSKLLKYHDL